MSYTQHESLVFGLNTKALPMDGHADGQTGNYADSNSLDFWAVALYRMMTICCCHFHYCFCPLSLPRPSQLPLRHSKYPKALPAAFEALPAAIEPVSASFEALSADCKTPTAAS